MIALQSLKYKIFEYCIDTLINKISNNFRVNPNQGEVISYENIFTGMRLSKIEIKISYKPDTIFTWLNCKIISREIYYKTLIFQYEQSFKNKEKCGEDTSINNRYQSWHQDDDGLMKFYI